MNLQFLGMQCILVLIFLYTFSFFPVENGHAYGLKHPVFVYSVFFFNFEYPFVFY